MGFLLTSFLIEFIPQPDESIPDPPDGEIPKCDSTYSIDIPKSFTVWEADPRPPNTSEVSVVNALFGARKLIVFNFTISSFISLHCLQCH